MIRVSFYSLEELAKLRKSGWLTYGSRNSLGRSRMMDQIQTLELELGFLKMFLRCLPIKSALRDSFVKATTVKSTEGLFDAGVSAVLGRFEDWDSLTSKLLEKIEKVKPRIRKICLDLLDGSFKRRLCNRFRLVEFLDLILNNLRNLFRLKSDKIVYVEIQIKTLEEKLNLFRNLVDFTKKRCTSSWELEKLCIYVQAWAYKAASLLFLCMVDGMQEEMASTLNDNLLVLLQMIKPCTPEVKGMCLRVLKASKSSNSDNLLMGEIVPNVVDFLLESAVVPINDSIQTIRDGLIILTTFLMNPPECPKDKKLMQIWKQIDTVMTEAIFVLSSLNAQQTNEEACKENSCFYAFLEKIDKVKAMITRFYVNIADSSKCNFPRTNVLGFIDFLLDNLGNLEEKFRHKTNFIPFAKHQILTIQEELMSVRPYLKDIFAMQHEQNDLWIKITRVAYQADHLIDLCQTMGYPIWHTMISLSHLVNQIKHAKNEVLIFGDKHSRKTRVSSVKPFLSQSYHAGASFSRIDNVVVGFYNEAETIVDKLTRGSKQLKVISIVGMPGIGKTTLAKVVYNDARVRSYFYKCSWCVVSQSYERRELVLAIFSNLVSEDMSYMKEDELAENLRKSLKKQRYLIVLDDIWDIRALKDLEETFPDDDNGSRILFTSRIHNLALLPNPVYYTHPLRLLSFVESSKLLQEKLKLKGGIPSNLSLVAKQVVQSCKGLPLSIVVVAGLLQRGARNLDWWTHIAERIHSKLASEGGCMDILQLSYNDLPEFLKPCFLYFSVFREDQVIEVKKLIQLWIAEGFIQKNGMRNLEEVAMGYLMDLIDRSLVIVSKQSVIGKVKACQIHDLFYELCLEKATEENFLYSFHVSFHTLSCLKYDHPRLSIHDKMWTSSSMLELNFTGSSSVRTLLMSSTTIIDVRVVSMFDFLRVLNSENIHFGWHLPPEIVLLIHLRYLGISCQISDVPSAIANLENLETFRVYVSGSNSRINFPESIWMMKKLRHIDMGDSAAVFALRDDELEETSQLDNLDSFSWLALYENKGAEKVLRKLPRIRELSIRPSKWSPQERFLERLSTWVCDQDCIQVPVLNFLSNLESLNLCFDQKSFHTCQFSFPSSLKKLRLSKFCRPWSEISVIGMLPHLEVLKLESDAFVGKIWDVEDELFLNLKYLKLKSLDLVEWNTSFDSFPCLERLVVEECFELEEIPSTFGQLCTLKSIEVHDSQRFLKFSSRYPFKPWTAIPSTRAASSASQILKEQQEMGNEGFNVLINDRPQSLRSFKRSDYLERELSEQELWKTLCQREEVMTICSVESFQRESAVRFRKHFFPLILQWEEVIPSLEKCDEKEFIGSSTMYDSVKKPDFTNVEGNRRRAKTIKCKYNCQSRQAILGRHIHQCLK